MSALKDLQELNAGDYEFAEAWEYWGKEHGKAVVELIEASKDEVLRMTLTSMAAKFDFARKNGIADLSGVNQWMINARNRFESASKALTEQS